MKTTVIDTMISTDGETVNEAPKQTGNTKAVAPTTKHLKI
jgi:hypothetical protein